MLGAELSKGRNLSFSMMSQHLLHARHATLEAAVCLLANGNNLAGLRTQPTEACMDAQVHTLSVK